MSANTTAPTRARPNLNMTAEKFVNALHDFQSATCDTNRALIRLTRHSRAFLSELNNLVVTTNRTKTGEPCVVLSVSKTF